MKRSARAKISKKKAICDRKSLPAVANEDNRPFSAENAYVSHSYGWK